MERTILHADMNNFYASCECMLNPELKKYPLAVCGSQEERHGIVLAKNYIAKSYQIQTGESIYQAKMKCPNLVIVQPHYDLYLKYSKLAKDIYSYYTDQIESFGIDECWLDVSHCIDSNYSGKDIANELREKIKDELGLTISVGVSFNKVFAKLGSDMKKPDASTVIDKFDFKTKIWPLPARDLLFVGPKTGKKLESYGITTIGRLAQTSDELLHNMFGINGLRIKMYANGLDTSPVIKSDYVPEVKSVGHGMTFLSDIYTNEEAKVMIYRLSLGFYKKLKEIKKKARAVQITIRDNSLFFKQFQTILPYPTNIPKTIADCAYALFKREYSWAKPVRNITIRAIDLIDEDLSYQLDFFNDYEKIEKEETLSSAINEIKNRYGFDCIKPASLLSIPKYPQFGIPQKIHPPGGIS